MPFCDLVNFFFQLYQNVLNLFLGFTGLPATGYDYYGQIGSVYGCNLMP